MNLADLVPNPRAVDDLTWRFNGEADAEMGLRSNLGGFINLIERGISNPGGGDIDNGRQTAAATRVRRIDWALEQAGIVRGEKVTRLAQIHYGTPPPPWSLGGGPFPKVVPYLSPVLGVVAEAKAAHARSRSRRPLPEWLDRLGSKLATGRLSKGDEVIAAELRRIADRVVFDVVAAYGRGRKLLPREQQSRAA